MQVFVLFNTIIHLLLKSQILVMVKFLTSLLDIINNIINFPLSKIIVNSNFNFIPSLTDGFRSYTSKNTKINKQFKACIKIKINILK